MPCEALNHDFKNLKRHGRANWRCPKCGENVMLLLVLSSEDDIDLTEVEQETVEFQEKSTHNN